MAITKPSTYTCRDRPCHIIEFTLCRRCKQGINKALCTMHGWLRCLLPGARTLTLPAGVCPGVAPLPEGHDGEARRGEG